MLCWHTQRAPELPVWNNSGSASGILLPRLAGRRLIAACLFVLVPLLLSLPPQGRVINFKNAVIILTSNLGSGTILESMERGPEAFEDMKQSVTMQVRGGAVGGPAAPCTCLLTLSHCCTHPPARSPA